MNYEEFLKKKSVVLPPAGLDKIPELNENLFDFQHDIVSWSLKRGRAAIFAGTGLGKTLMQLSWADALVREKNAKVICFTPLAVAAQMVREGEKFGITAEHVIDDSSNASIQVTNYQKIDHFDLTQYDAVILDESSILKNHTGKYRTDLIERTKNIPYRLAATATPSPNDFMELGNHAEFLGIMSYTDMLSTFFVHDGGSTQSWRLKGHAESEFWKWMSSWSVMLKDPSDLGYDGSKYKLPKLNKEQHTIQAEYKADVETGMLFPMEAQTLTERNHARRSTIEDRCKVAAEIANASNECFVIWCNLNDESALLETLIPDAVQVIGSDTDEKKEHTLSDFNNGNIRVLITKPKISGFGMNWQHCHNTIFVGLNDSFEQLYQAIRRFWRFGQKHEVNAHFISSEIEGAVVSNIAKKEKQAEHMMSQMISHTASLSSQNIKGAVRETTKYNANEKMEIPSWIK